MRLQCRLRELMAQKSRERGQKITYADITKGTGIYDSTLVKLANNRFRMIGITTIERLCEYFECDISDLFVLVRDNASSEAEEK